MLKKNKTITTSSTKQTSQFAEKFTNQLKSGCVLGLVGELGAGKTQFVKGLAKGFGIKNPVTSPTFVLLKEYPVGNRQLTTNRGQRNINSRITNYELRITKFVHIDCYRLSSAEELFELGLEEYMKDKTTVIVIEWADKIKEILPKNTVWIEFTHGKKKDERKIKLIAC